MPFIFFFNDTATTEIYTLSLHDALPIYVRRRPPDRGAGVHPAHGRRRRTHRGRRGRAAAGRGGQGRDRKSTRLNSSHANISYAVFCLKKKTNPNNLDMAPPARAEAIPAA